MPAKHRDLQALRRLLKELERVLKLDPLPPGIQARSAELFQSIFALTDDLIQQTPASQLGTLGGMKTAERGSDYGKSPRCDRPEREDDRRSETGHCTTFQFKLKSRPFAVEFLHLAAQFIHCHACG